MNFVVLCSLLECRRIGVTSVESHAEELNPLLAREDDPCRGQRERNDQNSQANLGSEEEVGCFRRRVLDYLRVSVRHCEIFWERNEENRGETERKTEKRKVE